MDAFGHKADKSKVNIGEMLTANDKEFYFDYQNGEYGFNTDPDRGAATFIPFKSGGAVLIGTYSANTTVDVSAYGATSADQFLCVCPSSGSADGLRQYIPQGGNVAYYSHYAAPSVALNGNTLTITVGRTYTSAWGDGSTTYDHTTNLSTEVYFVGDIESNT